MICKFSNSKFTTGDKTVFATKLIRFQLTVANFEENAFVMHKIPKEVGLARSLITSNIFVVSNFNNWDLQPPQSSWLYY